MGSSNVETVKLDGQIISYEVVKKETQPEPVPPAPVSDKTQRPAELSGKTYKIKTPLSEHALYVTINDLDGRPFELFISSKNMQHFQWMVAMTRLISAVFRKGGDCSFLIEELQSVFDPNGGYFRRGRYMPSLVAEIGQVVEQHMRDLGLIEDKKPDLKLVKTGHDLEKAEICGSCQTKAAVVMDGCLTCVNCGASKCS